MPHQFTKLTPSLVVSDVARSIAFYRDRLGFSLETTVPDAPPYLFAIVRSGGVEVFLNAPEPSIAEYPVFKDKPIGGTLTLFIEMTGIQEWYVTLRDQVTVVMPIEAKWYGVTEFAILDPDGYVITFAERNS
jgi:catechol 2,3-dioxygenase-like lactoylglutathione lyase family enzyme